MAKNKRQKKKFEKKLEEKKELEAFERVSKASIPEDEETKKQLERRTKSISQIYKINGKPKERYTEQIKKEGLYTVRPTLNWSSGVLNTARIKEYYFELLKNKTLKDDKKLVDDLVKFRKQILQHRISADIRLYSRNQEVAGLKIYSVLIENGYEIGRFWEGRDIDASSFKTLVYGFGNYMAQFGGKNAVITQYPMNKEHIDHIEITFSFA